MFETICTIIMVVLSAGMTHISFSDDIGENQKKKLRYLVPLLVLLLPLLSYCLGVLHGGD